MSYQETKQIVSFIGSIVIFGLYCLYVFQNYPQSAMDSTDAFSFWGAVILILIPVSVVAKIVILIGFSIVYRIVSKEKEPAFSDERDKLIELKATRNSHYAFVLGFLLAMGSLVLDKPTATMFVILLLSGIVSEMIGVMTQLVLYRRGF
ncbi:MAG: hypothetical protein J7559_17625 [Cohnella sp.]|nr:hypothetical protein [Cohnella sp.]